MAAQPATPYDEHFGLRRGMSLTGRGELRVDRYGRRVVSRLYVREGRQGELTMAVPAGGGRDLVAHGLIRKVKQDRVEAEMRMFNGSPARGKMKLRFDKRRGWLERAEWDGRTRDGRARLDFRR